MRAARVATVSVVAAALTAAVARAIVLVVVVDGDSMLPTYADRDRLLVLTRGRRRPRRGEVVVVRGPSPGWTSDRPVDEAHVQLVKRVTAVGGDSRPDGAGAVPTGSVYVQGDSPGYDSRTFGPVDRDEVVGRVLLRLGTAAHFDRPRDRGAGHPA